MRPDSDPIASPGRRSRISRAAFWRCSAMRQRPAIRTSRVTPGSVRARCWPKLSSARAQQGFSPSETAIFVFSLKKPLFDRMAAMRAQRPGRAVRRDLGDQRPLDRLGLYTAEVFQRGREQVIVRQQQELLELSTPVVELWDGILALPLIGTLDSARTQVVMESLLQRIVETRRRDRHHRHHRRAHRRHAGRAAPAEDRRRGAADGRRLHHQRHPAADRADDRPPRRRPRHGRDQGDARRRVRDRAEALGLTVTEAAAPSASRRRADAQRRDDRSED